MGGRIDAYIDIASLYSYIAFTHIINNQALLAAHGVQVDIHPVLLGAINAASGNKPPWTLPAKAVYGNFDARRSSARAGKPGITTPESFMERSMTVGPLRALHFIKANYPDATYQTAWHWFLHCFWEPPNHNLTKPDVLAKALVDAPKQYPPPANGTAQDRLFSEADVKKILQGAGSQEIKDSVKAKTQEAIDHGAFGAPWFWAVNDQGKGEPFFGSDRFHFIYEYLSVPYQDIAILPPRGKTETKL
ncbi:DSBA-like thioredoxin domain-containing protein [Colletotrichum orchidophilum]|uniref:DSBA-like thioredoxin domain-containing protein n=1 Tax=Colletotrichum orchidophilum TaxID=1209926 RepID=A0A1G4AZU8_9PEZI|nr:DSBA-like thioredoxin domain-containing protein [Colletotrichum orchidophilum]OHE94636.1 DSBA-like thioredoxin domain-containing protein [Colletotrichum orchidophilum]